MSERDFSYLDDALKTLSGINGYESVAKAYGELARLRAPEDSGEGVPFDPIARFPGEYELGRIVRKAVDHDPERMRFYLICSVGELAQRIARWMAASGEREGVLNGSATPTTVTTGSPGVAPVGSAPSPEECETCAEWEMSFELFDRAVRRASAMWKEANPEAPALLWPDTVKALVALYDTFCEMLIAAVPDDGAPSPETSEHVFTDFDYCDRCGAYAVGTPKACSPISTQGDDEPQGDGS